LFFYEPYTGVWKASLGDTAGTLGGPHSKTEHVMNAWACYLTDGSYSGWKDLGDFGISFSLLSWNQYNATCTVTFID
jgi:hypothetical protein